MKQIHKEFREIAKKYPSAVALQFEDENMKTMTYKVLDEQSDLLATRIREMTSDRPKKNAEDDQFVGVMTKRNMGMVVALLGIMKAECAYVPTDPSFPKDRKAYIFSHAGCSVLVVDEECQEEAMELSALVEDLQMLVIDGETGHIKTVQNKEKAALVDLSAPLYPSKLAYVLYTSGSTGKPKGVMVYHHGVMNILDWFAEDMSVTVGHHILGLTTFCFDISVLEMFMTLTRGATLILCSSDTQKDPFRIVELLTFTRIDIMQATPTTYELCMATGWTGSARVTFLVGGEGFRPKLRELGKNCKALKNVYGPTETSIWSSCYTYSPGQHGPMPDPLPIGRPIADTQFYIVNPDTMQLLSPGEEGELIIGGKGVSKGYLHRDDLTREKFLPNPYLRTLQSQGKLPANYLYGEIIYRTGDLCKEMVDGSGNYLYLNRMDDQVKIRGFRIELGEIETVLAEYPGVSQVAVVVRNDTLYAFVKLAKEVARESVNEQQLLVHVSGKLTYYMVPKNIFFVEEFPQTANGKMDKKMLVVPEPVVANPGKGGGASANATAAAAMTGSGLGSGHHPLSLKPVLSSHHGKGEDNNEESGEGGGGGRRTMITFLGETVEAYNGHFARAQESLAMLGVDSLGAVLFRNSLRKKLDGLTIDAKVLYGPDSTIASISSLLQKKLQTEKSSFWQSLKLDEIAKEDMIDLVGGAYSPAAGSSPRARSHASNSPVPGGSAAAGDLEDGVYHDDNNDEVGSSYSGASPSQREVSFEQSISSNRLIFEGLRGLLTIMVYYGHFGDISLQYRRNVDTYLFVMMSGLTCQLQYNSAATAQQSSATDTANTGSSRGNKQQSSSTWNLTSFLYYKFVALFPLFWIALIFHIPIIVYYQAHFHPSNANMAKVVITRFFCLDTWFNWSGTMFGDLFFTGLIWNIFVVYGLAMTVYLRDKVYSFWMRLAVITCLLVMVLLEYNLVPHSVKLATYLPYFVIGILVGLFYQGLFLVPQGALLIEDEMNNAAAANNAANAHKNVAVRLPSTNSLGNGLGQLDQLEGGQRQLVEGETELAAMVSPTKTLRPDSQVREIEPASPPPGPGPMIAAPPASRAQPAHAAAQATAVVQEGQPITFIFWISLAFGRTLQRSKYYPLFFTYGPDLLTVWFLFLYIYSGYPSLDHKQNTVFNTWLLNMALPFLFAILVIWLLIQKKPQEKAWMHTVLQLRPVQFLGELSYPIYIFQFTLNDYWLRLLWTAADPHMKGHKEDATSAHYMNSIAGDYNFGWLTRQNLGIQLACFFINVFIAFLLQKIVQDQLVMRLVMKINEWSLERKMAAKATHKKEKRVVNPSGNNNNSNNSNNSNDTRHNSTGSMLSDAGTPGPVIQQRMNVY